MTLATKFNSIPIGFVTHNSLPKPQLARLCSFSPWGWHGVADSKDVQPLQFPDYTALIPFPHQLHISDISYTFIGFYYGGKYSSTKALLTLKNKQYFLEQLPNKRKKPTLSKRKKKKRIYLFPPFSSPHPFFFSWRKGDSPPHACKKFPFAEVSVLEQIEQCEEEISIETLLWETTAEGLLGPQVMPLFPHPTQSEVKKCRQQEEAMFALKLVASSNSPLER